MIGVALTCPCHAIPLLLLLLVGGGAGTAWLAQNMGIAITVLAAVFLFSLWLLLKPRAGASVGDQHPLRPDLS